MKLIMTLIKQHSIPKHGLCMFLVIVATLSLSACGGKKNISTEDSSADYKSAQALPPLKKPSRVVVAGQSAPSSPLVSEPDVSVVGTSPQELTTSTNGVSDNTAQDDSGQGSTSEADVLSSSVVAGKSGEMRLQVEAGFEETWDYLSASLQKSDITVFSRNKAAGRFSIGCANIAAAPTVSTSGRWSFFNRSKQQNLEYCALQALEKRGITVVSVLNRAGEEVSGEYSNDVFSRILNN